MELIVLGSGTSVPHAYRSSSGFWLQTNAGTILLDCSASSIHRMAQEDLDWPNLDVIWISHFHLDHCGGLAPFLFSMKHAPITQHRTKPLRIIGAKGLRDLLATFSNANDYDLLTQPFPIQILEIEPLEKIEIIGNVEAVAYSTQHTADSHALHLRDQDQTIVYTSDTGFDEKLATFARRVDLLLIECSFVKNKPTEKHLELSEAIHLIRRSEPKQAVITHLYPEWDEVDFAEEVGKFDPRVEVIQAFDGLKINMGKGEK